MKKIDRREIICYVFGYVFWGLIIFACVCGVAKYTYDRSVLTSFEDSVCMTYGYEQATDKTIISGRPNKPSYKVIECDNHFQTAVFNKVLVFDKWNESRWLKKIVVSCEDYRFNQSVPDNNLPIVTYPNDCFDSDSHNCFIDGYIGSDDISKSTSKKRCGKQ